MSPEVVYEQVEKQSNLKHPLRRGRAPIVPISPTKQVNSRNSEEEKELAQVRNELSKVQQSQELFAAGLAVQLFLSAAVPHAGVVMALIQEIAFSTLEEPSGDEVDKAVLKGAIGQGVTSVTGVG